MKNRHLQTIVPNSPLRPRRSLPLTRERIELPDGDFLDVDWNGAGPADPASPIVIVLHGLEGSVRSRYALDLLDLSARAGWRSVVMHFRGCSGELNRLDRGYHAGETGDLHFFLATLHARYPDAPLAGAGYSLGGNVLLKYLGERSEQATLSAAVAVSVPFRLDVAADTISRGFSRIYQYSLMQKMRQTVQRKFAGRPAPVDLERVRATRTFFEFDDLVTAPIHGFAGAADYYARCSCIGYLKDIGRPTLILHAEDDPFVSAHAIPGREDLGEHVTMELSAKGGHVGFIGGNGTWRPGLWLPARISDFLAEQRGFEPR